jgi:hypothetical protein
MIWFETLRHDTRYAARSLRRSPVLTAVAALSLALGIGSATAVVTLANVMLLGPLPFPAAERLVVPYQAIARGGVARTDTTPWSVARYRRLRELVPAFEDAGFSTRHDMNVRGSGPASTVERVRVEVVTASLISTHGARPAHGRAFGADEDVPGVAYAAALVSDRLWRRRGTGIGTPITLDGAPVTVVGIMPPGFTGFASAADVRVPLHAVLRSVVRPGAARHARRPVGHAAAVSRGLTGS